MVYGEYLSRCTQCGKSFTCGDCIEHVCFDCKYGTNISVMIDEFFARLNKIKNEIAAKQESEKVRILTKRLAEAEKVIDDVVRGRDLCHENGIEIKPIFLSRIMHAEDYRAKYPRTKGGE
jgi:hypothetical protein